MLETVQAFAGFVEEPHDLDPVLELLNDERFGRCVEEAFRIGTEAAAAEDEAAVEFGGFEVEQLGSEGLGDAGVGVQLTGEFTASGSRSPSRSRFSSCGSIEPSSQSSPRGSGPTSRPPTELPCSRSLSTA